MYFASDAAGVLDYVSCYYKLLVGMLVAIARWQLLSYLHLLHQNLPVMQLPVTPLHLLRLLMRG